MFFLTRSQFYGIGHVSFQEHRNRPSLFLFYYHQITLLCLPRVVEQLNFETELFDPVGLSHPWNNPFPPPPRFECLSAFHFVILLILFLKRKHKSIVNTPDLWVMVTVSNTSLSSLKLPLPTPIFIIVIVVLCSPKSVRQRPNRQYISIWPYLKRGSWQRKAVQMRS